MSHWHTLMFELYPEARPLGLGKALEEYRFNVIKDLLTSRMSLEVSGRKSVVTIEVCLVVILLGLGLPLPSSCLLPLGHTAVLRCQPKTVFLQIANSNYSPVFWAISFSSLHLSFSHLVHLCILVSVCC